MLSISQSKNIKIHYLINGELEFKFKIRKQLTKCSDR